VFQQNSNDTKIAYFFGDISQQEIMFLIFDKIYQIIQIKNASWMFFHDL
jgi:hypothetical protein